jgi:hypothetical protein
MSYLDVREFYIEPEEGPAEPFGWVDGEPDYTLDDLEWDELFDFAVCPECGAELASGHYLICSQSEK